MRPLRVITSTVALVLVFFGVDRPCLKAEVANTYSAALRSAGQLGKPVLIDFYADWCRHCKEMDRVVNQIPDAMAHFVYLRVNAERDVPLAKKFGVKSYPTVVCLKPDGSEFHRWSGAYQTPQDMTAVLNYVLQKAGPTELLKAPAVTVAEDPAPPAPPDPPADVELKRAMKAYSLGRDREAGKMFRHIVDTYPDTSAAQQAREKLAKLGVAPVQAQPTATAQTSTPLPAHP